jgi:hypothetical protein
VAGQLSQQLHNDLMAMAADGRIFDARAIASAISKEADRESNAD